MRTNLKGRPNFRGRQSLNRSDGNLRNGSNIRSRIGTTVAKPKGDLRQMLKKKKEVPSSQPSTSNVTSNVKSRLGLQSKTAKIEALKEAKAHLRSIQDKQKPNDNKFNQTKGTSAPKRPNDQRPSHLTRNPTNLTSRSSNNQDRNLASSRRPLDRSRDYRGRNSGSQIKSITQPIIIPHYIPSTSHQPVVYSQPQTSGIDIGAITSAINGAIKSIIPGSRSSVNFNSGGNISNTVLVTNLSPKITEDEVAELFGDIGPLMNVQIINSTTALVTYYASQHASKAVKVYNFRLLDGIAMNCTQLNPTSASSISATSPIQLHSRMYSDLIPSRSSGQLRSNMY